MIVRLLLAGFHHSNFSWKQHSIVSCMFSSLKFQSEVALSSCAFSILFRPFYALVLRYVKKPSSPVRLLPVLEQQNMSWSSTVMYEHQEILEFCKKERRKVGANRRNQEKTLLEITDIRQTADFMFWCQLRVFVYAPCFLKKQFVQHGDRGILCDTQNKCFWIFISKSSRSNAFGTFMEMRLLLVSTRTVQELVNVSESERHSPLNFVYAVSEGVC